MDDAELALTAAGAGAAEVRRRFGTVVARHDKGGGDFATEADLAAEAAIRAVLARHRPGDAVVGEEAGRTGPEGADRTWLVDPLCGTRNFAAGTGPFGVNVALWSDDAAAAATADPLTGETWWTDGRVVAVRIAERDRPAAPSPTTALVELNLEPPFPNAPAFRVVDLAAAEGSAATFGLRVSSTSLALAWVAGGRRAAYVSDGDLAGNVHFAAPLALCRAAGCVVTNLVGGALHTGPGGLVAAADAATHAALVALIVRRHARTPPPAGAASG